MKLTIIQQKIYEIRGQKVLLDFDLAALYGVQTKHLKEAVRRNKKRFPPDFMFQLNKSEFALLRSQIATSNKRGGTRYMPFAFTEQGVGMLSGVLNSEKAIQMHITIVRAFIALKQFTLNYKDLADQIKKIKLTVGDHSLQLKQIYEVLKNMLTEKIKKRSWDERERIGFRTGK